jgi:hypothetical protein
MDERGANQYYKAVFISRSCNLFAVNQGISTQDANGIDRTSVPGLLS